MWYPSDDAIRDGEAKPGSFADLLGREERFEDLAQVLPGYSASGVSDRKPDPAIVALDGDGEDTTVRHCIASIAEKIRQDLVDLVRVQIDFRKRDPGRHLQLDLLGEGVGPGSPLD
jgi:hypothetical protein